MYTRMYELTYYVNNHIEIFSGENLPMGSFTCICIRLKSFILLDLSIIIINKYLTLQVYPCTLCKTATCVYDVRAALTWTCWRENAVFDHVTVTRTSHDHVREHIISLPG